MEHIISRNGLLYYFLKLFAIYIKFTLTRGVGLSAPNKKIGLSCSKQTNLMARFGVSANTGGKIPFQKADSPSLE